MKNRQAGGRFGDSGTELDLDRERELRRRARWEPETFEAAVAELEREPSRLRWLGLDVEDPAELGRLKSKLPTKVTRLELEIALVERRLSSQMSPRSALAYASWIVAAERGWNPANLEAQAAGQQAPQGAMAPTFGFLDGKAGGASGEGAEAGDASAMTSSMTSTEAAEQAEAERLAEGSGVHDLSVLLRNPLRAAAKAERGAASAEWAGVTGTTGGTSTTGTSTTTAAATRSLRDELLAAAEKGEGAREVLAAADPSAATAALRELRSAHVPGHTAPALRVLTREAGGEVDRLLGSASSSGERLAPEQAERLGGHVSAEAASSARLHTDDDADALASAHQAHAITIGNQIFFGRGELAPGTAAGDDLLVHELTHVAQGQRGELMHAAAKLTSGINLEPGEAEAELRAKLAVIELHAPPANAPAVAAPGGQPSSDGERAQRIASQKARITLAEDDTIPDEESKPPAPSNPLAAVNHPVPEMAAPPKGGGKENAYVATFDEAPSKQAMGAWGQVAAKATTAANAEQAAFDAGLPPMPIVLDGGEGKAAKGGEASAKVKAKEPPQGAVPPAAKPTTPTAAAPVVTAASTSVQNIIANPDKAAMETEGKKAIAALPVTSPDVKTDPGTPPVTDLAGQADPVRATGDQQTAYADGAKALEAEKKKILSGPGAAQIQPKQMNEKLAVPKAEAPGQMPELPKVEGMDKFKKWSLPSDVQTSFDSVAKPKMDANLAQAKAKMTEAETKRDADRDKAVADSQAKVKTAHADADAKQQAKVSESRTKIANKQSETLGKQEAEVKKLDKESGTKKKSTLAKVNDRIAKDQTKVETDYTDAQKKADGEKTKGEEDVKKKKAEAEKKANEEKSWWDKVADAVCDAIQAIADEIDKALEAVGKLIGDILDAVKEAACSLIDAARDFVCAALEEFGDWLKSAVTALIGSVFPELAAALNKFIDDAVNVAKDAVNAVADGLKDAVTALCDGLKASINAAIATFRAAVQAAATLAQALVTGDWAMVAKMVLEGILKLLGIDPAAFYALVGKAEDSIAKIIDDPGAFVGHLVDAVKLGFSQFGDNFLTHLKDGVVQWLFGTFAEAGINIPATFDVAGVFDLTCQVLGLTWPRLRVKVVKVIGEENTERLEFVSQYVEALVTGGFGGLWEKVQQDMAGLWETVIGGAKQWLMEKLVQQAIIKIATMWNPAGAIIQLIQTAWNVYCWVKENAQRIFGLVQAVVDSISNIANGNISGAANYIESSLAKLVPIAISLFANLLGLGGIADKIKDIITKIQTRVDQAIDKLIDRVMGMFKGKDKKGGKDGDKDAKGEGKDGEKADENKVVGARITFTVGSATHTQYIDKGVPMVASTPTGVKAKIEEWRPRLRELSDEQKKTAGGLIGKAIGIEKKVATLATEAKTDKAKEAPLEAKQRELADTLAKLWEIMAPDMDASKSFADQDPMATLKSPQYAQFKSRFLKLAGDLDMPGGDAKAQELWLKMVGTLQKTDASYKAAPTAAGTDRKDLSSAAMTGIMAEFDPIIAALSPYMEKYAKGKKSWAFWSGKPAVELAKRNAEVCLEKSAIGALFDNINISGGWDIQMWASLSKAYATHAAKQIGSAKFSGFVGLGSSSEQSIFNKIEQPQFASMLSEKQKVDLHIDWYAGACNPENINEPDERFIADGVKGVYAKGDRAAMVEKAESENKRRIALWKEKGINEGPEGGSGEEKEEPIDGVAKSFDTVGEGHSLTIVEKGDGKGKILMASSNPEELNRKAENVRKTMRAYEAEPSIPDDFKIDVMIMVEAVEAELARIKEMTEAELFANATSTKKRKAEEVSKGRRQKAITALDKAAAEIRALATRFGLPDLSPHGVEVAKEKAWEAKVLKPVQAKIDAILAKYKARILSLIPGAKVKYRGSLVSGWKGPHKLSPDGAALRFDSKPYDCDAFIEVSAATWTTWMEKNWVPREGDFVDLADLGDPETADGLSAIQDEIAQELKDQVPGYLKERGKAKFDFRLQAASLSARQKRQGIAYPEGALNKAGLPETEAELPKGTAYQNDVKVDGRIKNEEHREI